MKLAVDADGKSLGSCTTPYPEFQNFEIGSECYSGAEFNGQKIGCMVPFGKQNEREVTLPGLSLLSFIKKKILVDTLMDVVDEAYKRLFVGPPVNFLGKPADFSPNLPDIYSFPQVADVINSYKQYYNDNMKVFRSLPTRCGYIMGKNYYDFNFRDGKDDVIPVIQKKFGDKYFTLFYKYTTEALKGIAVDNVADWITQDADWNSPKITANLISDPNDTYKTIDEFLNDKKTTYRDRYFIEFMKKNSSRFTIIVEVYNEFNKDPIFTLGLVKYSRDEDNRNFTKFFGKGHVTDKYTSNKKIIEKQYDYKTFQIDCGNSGASWVIGNLPENCRSTPVFMAILNGNQCNWQNWLKGYIMVAQDDPIDLAAPIADFDTFKIKHVGQWMNVWMCAEEKDPFQDIQMTKSIFYLDPYKFYKIFNRENGQTDEQWAAFIYLNISGDLQTTSAKYTKTYKTLLGIVKGKNNISFDDYKMVCTDAIGNKQTIVTSQQMGCLRKYA